MTVSNTEINRDINVILVAYGSVAALSEALGTLGSSSPVVVIDNQSSPESKKAAADAGRDMSTRAEISASRRR